MSPFPCKNIIRGYLSQVVLSDRTLGHMHYIQALHPDTMLAVVFLGSWYLREAVTPMDILRWASDGRLPFLNLPALSAELLQSAQEAGCTLPPSLLQPTGAVQPSGRLPAVLDAAYCVWHSEKDICL